MSKKTKRFKYGFLLGMIIYAVLFLALVAVGLNFFWKFIAAYEESRPLNTINAYMEQLTKEHICDTQADVIAGVDHNLQSEEACRQLLLDGLEGDITYAKKTSESTDSKTVYALRCGSRVIGSVTMTTTEIDEYNFARWEISEEQFDLSYLLETKAYRVTVPEEFSVYVNGYQLDESYIVETGIQYEVLERYYKDYDLPTMVTYEAELTLGELEPEVRDSDGKVVQVEEDTDFTPYLYNCTSEETAELDTFLEDFIGRYVTFTGNANNKERANYASLMELVVPESDLASRMKMALDGLTYAQSKKDEVASITIHSQIALAENCYLCDVTYLVDTTGREGVVRITNNMKIIVIRTDNGLRAEQLTSY